jgi:hypothetical protein
VRLQGKVGAVEQNGIVNSVARARGTKDRDLRAELGYASVVPII